MIQVEVRSSIIVFASANFSPSSKIQLKEFAALSHNIQNAQVQIPIKPECGVRVKTSCNSV